MASNNNFLRIGAYILIGVIFLLAIGVFRNCANVSYSKSEGFSEGDTIDIALIYSPGSFYFYGDSLSGINSKIATTYSKESGQPIKLWPVTDPSSALEKLASGAFDVLASLPLDNSIKQRFPVSESIFLDRLVLVQLADSATGDTKIKSSLDLNGLTVHVAAGSSGLHRLRNLSDEIGGNIEIIESPEMSDELLCLQVAAGTISLAIANERVAKAIAEKYPNLKYDSSISFTQFQVWVFNPSDSILFSRFNHWWEGFHNSSDYRSIIDNF